MIASEPLARRASLAFAIVLARLGKLEDVPPLDLPSAPIPSLVAMTACHYSPFYAALSIAQIQNDVTLPPHGPPQHAPPVDKPRPIWLFWRRRQEALTAKSNE